MMLGFVTLRFASGMVGKTPTAFTHFGGIYGGDTGKIGDGQKRFPFLDRFAHDASPIGGGWQRRTNW
jgi:hypothetical protein